MAVNDNIPDGYLFRGARLGLVFYVVDQDNNDAPLDCTTFTLETEVQDVKTGKVLFTIASADHTRANGDGTGDKVTATITATNAALLEPGHQVLGTLRRTDAGFEYPLWYGRGVVGRLAG